MGDVIQMFQTPPEKIEGVSIAVACMANRYRLAPEESTALAIRAHALLSKGESPARVRRLMYERARRRSARNPLEAA